MVQQKLPRVLAPATATCTTSRSQRTSYDISTVCVLVAWRRSQSRAYKCTIGAGRSNGRSALRSSMRFAECRSVRCVICLPYEGHFFFETHSACRRGIWKPLPLCRAARLEQHTQYHAWRFTLLPQATETLPGMLELPTLRLTASQSNQLSYGSPRAKRLVFFSMRDVLN